MPYYNRTLPSRYNDFLRRTPIFPTKSICGVAPQHRRRGARQRAGKCCRPAATLILMLHAELATDYFMLRSQDAQQALLDRTVDAYTQALELTQHLYDGGAGTARRSAQAQAQLETAQDSSRRYAPAPLANRARYRRPVGRIRLHLPIDSKPLPLDVLPPAFDPGLPSALLQRRPDVAAAERRVAAANAQISASHVPPISRYSACWAARDSRALQ